MFIVAAKVMAMVVVGVCTIHIEEKKESKKFEGFRRLYDADGNPLNEWVPVDYIG